MKYQKVLLIIALTATLMFSGCGTVNSSSADTNTSITSETTEQTVENTPIGSITEITETELTLAIMPESMGGGQPDGNDTPPDMPKNGNSEGTAPPDSTENPQETGDGSAPPDMPKNSGMGDMVLETVTLTVTDTTQILDSNGNTADFSSLEIGMMVAVETDSADNALTITISEFTDSIPAGKGPGGGTAFAPESDGTVFEEGTGNYTITVNSYTAS